MIWIATAPLWISGGYLVLIAMAVGFGVSRGYKFADGSNLDMRKVGTGAAIMGWLVLLLAAWLCGL